MNTSEPKTKCQCEECCPEIYTPSPARISSNHFAARWRDRGVLLLDGVDISLVAFEAMAGADGWVLAAHDHGDGKIHACKCGATGTACLERRQGHVEFIP